MTNAPPCVPTYTWPSADIAGVTNRVVASPSDTFALTAPLPGSSATNAPPFTLSTAPPPTIGDPGGAACHVGVIVVPDTLTARTPSVHGTKIVPSTYAAPPKAVHNPIAGTAPPTPPRAPCFSR